MKRGARELLRGLAVPDWWSDGRRARAGARRRGQWSEVTDGDCPQVRNVGWILRPPEKTKNGTYAQGSEVGSRAATIEDVAVSWKTARS